MESTVEEMLKEIEGLKQALVGDMLKDMNLLDEIHRLEMKLNGTKPTDTRVECEGCSG